MKLYVAYSGPNKEHNGEIRGCALVDVSTPPANADHFWQLEQQIAERSGMQAKEVLITFWTPVMDGTLNTSLKSIIRVLAIGVAFGGGLIAVQQPPIGIVACAIAAILMFL